MGNWIWSCCIVRRERGACLVSLQMEPQKNLKIRRIKSSEVRLLIFTSVYPLFCVTAGTSVTSLSLWLSICYMEGGRGVYSKWYY